MKTIIAPRIKPDQYEDIERQVVAIFRDIVFAPLIKIIEKGNAQAAGDSAKKFLNSADDDLRHALRTGKIQYQRGVFSGKFSAKTSVALRKAGAKFSKTRKTYSLSSPVVPDWMKAEAAVYEVVAQTVHQEINQQLDSIQRNLETAIAGKPVKAEGMVKKVTKDFRTVAEAIRIEPEITEQMEKKLASNYSTNMELWINNFTREEITELRQIVEDNALDGYRFDKLISKIQARFGVAETKAKFLARQETSLYVSQFRQQRYKEAGVIKYIWSTSHDDRVRESHAHLNGKEFFYDQPPVVSNNPMRHANPGEDFNCRCVDIAVLP